MKRCATGARVVGGLGFAVVFVAACWPRIASGYQLDKDGTIKFGLRTYVNARIGTEKTDKTLLVDNLGTPAAVRTLETQSFPESAAGHLRQNRFFIEAELDHDLRKLMAAGFGPLALLDDL